MPSGFLFISTTRFFDLRFTRRDFVNSSSRAISSAAVAVKALSGEIENR